MNRPFVFLNMAMTADGKITSAAREYPQFTSAVDRKTMDRLRAEADAVLVGAGTLRADDPPLSVRDEEMKAYRLSLGRPAELTTIVVTARAELDPNARFFREGGASGRRIVATIEDGPEDKLAAFAGRAEVIRAGRGQVDLRRLLGILKERGIERLLVEGGGELNWGFVRDDLVDEVNVTIAPCLLGGRLAPTLLEGDGLTMSGRRRLALIGVERVEDELYCRYRVIRD